MKSHGNGTKVGVGARAAMLALAVTAALGLAPEAPAEPKGIRIEPNGIRIKEGILPGAAPCKGPDLAVTSFRVGRIQQTGPYDARVELIATLRNVGRADFDGQNQGYFAILYTFDPDGKITSGVHQLTGMVVTNIPKGPGTMRTLRAWVDINPSKEFPGAFLASVGPNPIGPDVSHPYADCNGRNNQKVLREGAVQDTVFRFLNTKPIRNSTGKAIEREKNKYGKEIQRKELQRRLPPGILR